MKYTTRISCYDILDESGKILANLELRPTSDGNKFYISLHNQNVFYSKETNDFEPINGHSNFTLYMFDSKDEALESFAKYIHEVN